MIVPVKGVFEAHLTVANLQRAMQFYGETLGLELATMIEARKVAFYWLGGYGHTMLGIWETGTAPQRMSLHTAFDAALEDVLKAPSLLRAAGITPLDVSGNPVDEPVVLAWMPAVSIYFNDPDGNQLEYIAMLPEPPQPERGIVPWSQWRAS
ncbi:MAG: VOC family protein [Acidobacteria bacterium]|nr:VOC family protein [Acidobacteriota bacterium]